MLLLLFFSSSPLRALPPPPFEGLLGSPDARTAWPGFGDVASASAALDIRSVVSYPLLGGRGEQKTLRFVGKKGTAFAVCLTPKTARFMPTIYGKLAALSAIHGP